MAAKFGIVEVQAEVPAFFPARDYSPLFIPQPPGMSLGQVALVGIPITYFSNENKVWIEGQELLAICLGRINTLLIETVSKPDMGIVPLEPEKLRVVPDQIMAGQCMRR